jgi:hypothetical protein
MRNFTFSVLECLFLSCLVHCYSVVMYEIRVGLLSYISYLLIVIYTSCIRCNALILTFSVFRNDVFVSLMLMS